MTKIRELERLVTPNENLLINGDFSVWQRGTDITSTAGSFFSADRWNTYSGAPAGANVQRLVTGVAPVNNQFFMRVTKTGADLNTGIGFGPRQAIEYSGVRGGPMTVSVYARQQVGDQTGRLELQVAGYAGASDGTPAWTLGTPAREVPQDGWVRYTFTFTSPVSTTTNFIRVYLRITGTRPAMDFWGAKLENGGVATPFEQDNPEVNLAKCQRYFQKSYDLDIVPGTANSPPGRHVCESTGGQAFWPVKFSTNMRAAPRVRVYSYLNGALSLNSDITAGSDGPFTDVRSGQNGYEMQDDSVTNDAAYAWHWTADAEISV